MPNIKSSVRSVKTDAERRAKNAPVKAAIRNIARKVVALTETGTQEDAKATYVTASGLIDKVCTVNFSFFMESPLTREQI